MSVGRFASAVLPRRCCLHRRYGGKRLVWSLSVAHPPTVITCVHVLSKLACMDVSAFFRCVDVVRVSLRTVAKHRSPLGGVALRHGVAGLQGLQYGRRTCHLPQRCICIARQTMPLRSHRCLAFSPLSYYRMCLPRTHALGGWRPCCSARLWLRRASADWSRPASASASSLTFGRSASIR
jgi:hypothetical protein